jgi:hypothetical protein
MTPGELLWIVALCAYAVYQQTRRHEIVGNARFRLAILYGVIGLIVGGFNLPTKALSIVFLLISIVLSLVFGYFRGRLTRVWAEAGHVYSQGTPLTITLFLLLVASKFVLGAIAYVVDASDDGGVGEVLIMIAVMMAVQAQLIWRRAQPLGAPTSTTAVPVGF